MVSSALLRRIITQISPPHATNLVGAFAYGSVAFPQFGRPSSNDQLDLVFIVRDPVQWHLNNMKLFPSHYSPLMRSGSTLLKSFVSSFPGPQVYYNPFVSWSDDVEKRSLILKYGVVSLANFMQDLSTWSDLYLAGRLHKPVVWIHPEEVESTTIGAAQTTNLLSALSYAILHLSTRTHHHLNEYDLFHAIASISYDGDWRMLLGEDKKKVERLISGADRLSRFRGWYRKACCHPSVANVVDLSLTTDVGEVRPLQFSQSPISSTAVARLVNNLPDSICMAAVSRSIPHCDSPTIARDFLCNLKPTERDRLLKLSVNHVVRRSSVQQTILGFVTAGPVRSAVYAAAKLRKMLASLDIVKWK